MEVLVVLSQYTGRYDFSLKRELGPDETFRNSLTFNNNNNNTDTNTNNTPQTHEASSSSNSCSWSVFDDLYFDTVYDVSGSTEGTMIPVDVLENCNSVGVGVVKVGIEYSEVSKRSKICRPRRKKKQGENRDITHPTLLDMSSSSLK